MNLVIDSGNTRIKIGFFSGEHLKEKFLFESTQELFLFLKHHPVEQAIVSSVHFSGQEILNHIQSKRKLLLSAELSLPININYKTPATVGVDRIAVACGASSLFPEHDCLAIDAGTCITYDFIDCENNFRGGLISPGLSMRLKAMHTFTRRLPLVQLKESPALTGESTETCLQSGTVNGAVAEMNGIIEKYTEKYPHLQVILSGGDTVFFENKLKHPIFAAPDLVLVGLNRILLHHAQL